MKTIELYHFPHQLYPISQFETLCKTIPGFVHRLESTDTLCNEDGSEKNTVPEGDNVPVGFTEAAYLIGVFRDRGSALGFRLLDEDRIEWLCFDRPIQDFLSTARTEDDRLLFDPVARLERGDPAVKWKGKVGGYPEHRQWYDGLKTAVRPVIPLTDVETYRRLLDDIKAREAHRDSNEGVDD